jgi:hypothetical protein
MHIQSRFLLVQVQCCTFSVLRISPLTDRWRGVSQARLLASRHTRDIRVSRLGCYVTYELGFDLERVTSAWITRRANYLDVK